MQTLNQLDLDSTVGGLGDIWMRLVALYSLAALNPNVGVRFRLPQPLLTAARAAFPDRFELTSSPLPGAYQFTHLGLRHLFFKVLQGERFASPFIRILQSERKQTRFKDSLNDRAFALLETTRRIKQPPLATVAAYQGFHELSMFGELSAAYPEFVGQAKRDLPGIRSRLQRQWPGTHHPAFATLVFPGGSAHQIMPPLWAKANLPAATFAFFASDPSRSEFEALGLASRTFKSTEDLLQLLAAAKRTLVTDSFPSHVAQTYTSAATVMLTEQVTARTVHPAFEGSVVPTTAPCAPCKHIAQSFGRCEAGHEYCVTWLKPEYTNALLAAAQ